MKDIKSVKNSLKVSSMIFICALAFSCSGDGHMLNSAGEIDGNEDPTDALAFEPFFTNVQSEIFDASCISCHGSGAAGGLDLSSSVAYANMVGVASSQSTQLNLIEPSDPDNSYIIRKMEGTSGIIGAAMPLGSSAVSQNLIDAFRNWISEGAEDN